MFSLWSSTRWLCREVSPCRDLSAITAGYCFCACRVLGHRVIVEHQPLWRVTFRGDWAHCGLARPPEVTPAEPGTCAAFWGKCQQDNNNNIKKKEEKKRLPGFLHFSFTELLSLECFSNKQPLIKPFRQAFNSTAAWVWRIQAEKKKTFHSFLSWNCCVSSASPSKTL